MLNPWGRITFNDQPKRNALRDQSATIGKHKPSTKKNNLPTTDSQEQNRRDQKLTYKQNPQPPSEEEIVIQTEGHEEALKEQIKKQEQTEEKFNKLVANSKLVLFETKTTFPFTFFPNKIVITLNDVSVIFNEYISKQIRTIPISKVAEVIVETGFFFAKLRIVDIDYSQNSIEIDYLGIKHAMKAKRLILGLLFARREEVDITKLGNDNIAQKIEELGRVQGEQLDQKE